MVFYPNLENMSNFSNITGVLSIITGIIFWIGIPRGYSKSLFSAQKVINFPVLLLGITALCLSVGLTTVLSHYFPGLHSTQSEELLQLMNDPVGITIVVILVLFFAPLAEEFLFRGVLIDGACVFLRQKPNVATLLSATLFALSHGITHFPGGFLFAFCLGLMRIRTQSIRGTAFVHGLNNLFGLGVLYYQSGDIPLALAYGMVVTGGVGLTYLLLSTQALSKPEQDA